MLLSSQYNDNTEFTESQTRLPCYCPPNTVTMQILQRAKLDCRVIVPPIHITVQKKQCIIIKNTGDWQMIGQTKYRLRWLLRVMPKVVQNELSFLTVTGKFSVTVGTLLYIFGSYERHCKPTKEMCIPLRLTPKGGTLCCRL